MRTDRKRGGCPGLGKRIRTACEVRGIAPTTLGEKIGLGRGHMSHILKDENRDIAASTLRAICEALNVSCEWLLTQQGPFDRQLHVGEKSPTERKTQG